MRAGVHSKSFCGERIGTTVSTEFQLQTIPYSGHRLHAKKKFKFIFYKICVMYSRTNSLRCNKPQQDLNGGIPVLLICFSLCSKDVFNDRACKWRISSTSQLTQPEWQPSDSIVKFFANKRHICMVSLTRGTGLTLMPECRCLLMLFVKNADADKVFPALRHLLMI
jgi:hypothetical protein